MVRKGSDSISPTGSPVVSPTAVTSTVKGSKLGDNKSVIAQFDKTSKPLQRPGILPKGFSGRNLASKVLS